MSMHASTSSTSGSRSSTRRLDGLRVEIRGDLDRQTVRLVRWLVATVLGSIAAVGGAVAGIAALVS